VTLKSYFYKFLKYSYIPLITITLLSTKLEDYFSDYMKTRIDDLGSSIWLLAAGYAMLALFFFSLQMSLFLLPIKTNSFKSYSQSFIKTVFTIHTEAMINFGKSASWALLFVLPGIWMFLRLTYTYHASVLWLDLNPENTNSQALSPQKISSQVFKNNKIKTVFLSFIIYAVVPFLNFSLSTSDPTPSFAKELFVCSILMLVQFFSFYYLTKIFIKEIHKDNPTNQTQEPANGINFSMATN